MAGYAQQIINVPFHELSDDGDLVWVVIRNPRLQTIDSMAPDEVELDESGTKPKDPKQALAAMYANIAKLVVAWRVYDATADVEVTVDEQTGEARIADAPLLPAVNRQNPATPEMVRRLPAEITNRIGKIMLEAVNPQ